MGTRGRLLLCQLLLVFLSLAKHSEGWSWRCENKRCVRSLSPDPETVLGSLEVCRLTCQPYGSIWPQPTGLTVISDKVAHIHPSKVSFDYSSIAYFSRAVVSDFVTAISRVFISNLWQMCGANCSEAVDTSSVTVTIDTASADLTLNWTTDESYSLEVTSSTGGQVAAYIRANTVFGARHGLETLSQLVTLVQMTGTNQLVMLATAKVNDKPVYPHRGLLLDTARNFLPLSAIKRSVDAMAACKLNVLHWHATDSQSFPLVLPRVPQLARYGAYSSEEVYTMEDMDMMIKYARERGIRIVLELDMPAHAGNGWQWGPEAGLGSLAVCVNQQPWRQFCPQPPCGQLNPANPALYRVLRDVFQDLADHLPDNEALHMGGDEVFFPCWSQSPEVTDWMKSLGLGVSHADFLTVWAEFHKKVLKVWDEVVGHNKSPVLLWTSRLTDPDVISKYLDKDRFVIEAWTDEKDPKVDRLLAKGYRLIMATQDAWYLDHGFWGGMKYYNWRRVYDNRLSRAPGVLGGEVAMWGELVDEHNLDSLVWPRATAAAERLWSDPSHSSSDHSYCVTGRNVGRVGGRTQPSFDVAMWGELVDQHNLDIRVWPRATAAAERLWSDPSHSSSDAEDRLVTQRERLVWRGVRPETITPQWCAHNPGLCLGSANTS